MLVCWYAGMLVCCVYCTYTVEDHLTFQAKQRGIPSQLIVAEVQRVVSMRLCEKHATAVGYSM